MSTSKKKVVVVGNGMVGHRFVQRMLAKDALERFEMTVLCEEPRLAYDRVNLSKLFEPAGSDRLSLVAPGEYARPGLVVRIGEAAVALDRAAKTVRASGGDVLDYDHLVLASGSLPFVPPVEGRARPGCFVYRKIEDLEAIKAWAARAEVNVGVVVGGGLLGLEAANALRNLGLETHVLEMAPRLMPLQVDETGGAILKRRI